MQPGQTMTGDANHSGLRVYCYRGKPKNVIYLWQTVSVSIMSYLINIIKQILGFCVVSNRFGLKQLRHISWFHAERCFQRVRGGTFWLVF